MSVGAEEILPADFGKYRLSKRIATGGMAEIFLAHPIGKPDQPLVIKRILPHLAKSQEFLSMFLDEARIAAQLQHPNIAHIEDIGQIEGSSFIAMEYVHGEDIRRIYNCAYKYQRSLPLSHSIRVIADAALGLGYAHKLTDFAGRPMGVVHRDVSPQNILVTYDGNVKIVDFGIAKAANKVSQTRAGVLKGKYSYMSPEQALGDPIDHRTDIFALGIILYETTTGTRLFKRHNELATLQAIIKCEILPPADALPGYPAELEAILLKALARDPGDRFADAQELSEALYDFLHTSELFVEREVIAEFMKDLFRERLEEEEAAGAPVLPEESEVKEDMRDATTPMRGAASPRGKTELTPPGDGAAHPANGAGRETSQPMRGPPADPPRTRIKRWDRDDPGQPPSDPPRARAGGASTAPKHRPGFNDSPESDPEPTGLESDLEDLGLGFGLDSKLMPRAEPPATDMARPRRIEESRPIRARGIAPEAVISQNIPSAAASPRNRGSTEVIRPSHDPLPAFDAGGDYGQTIESGRYDRPAATERSSDRLRPNGAGEPRLSAEGAADTAIDSARSISFISQGTVTHAGPPADMMPTLAAQPVYQGPAEPSSSRSERSRGGPVPERAILRGPAEETEQVRARAQVASLSDRDRSKNRRRPARPEPPTGSGPKIAIAVGAIVAAMLAGVVASRLHARWSGAPGVGDGPVPAACFGRATVLTEPNAAVYAGPELLGRAGPDGSAGPFLVPAGQHVVRVAISDVGFERERALEIQCDRIHEFEIRGRKGWLSLKVQPWAKVRLDGHDLGITPLPNVQLYEGTHELRLENPELGRRFVDRVRIEAGQVRELKLSLSEVGEPL